MASRSRSARPRVQTGLDVLAAQRFKRLKGARVGLLVHAASVDAQLRHTVDLMLDAGIHLVRLFGPEHGLHAVVQDMAHVRSSKDARTGLKVVSLYGNTPASLRPSPRELADLDVLVMDLQDIGSRYYTFAYTVAFALHACGQAGVTAVVLDRPNPLGGLAVEGNTVAPALQSFVGAYPLAVRHGLTMGELAMAFNGPLLPPGEGPAALDVVWMKGWQRSMLWADTGLPWVLPSPNMPTPDTALVYPGGCLYEGTNLSEGRGTTRPFELVGAPWLDPYRLADALASEKLPGVTFRPCYFGPTFHKWAGQSCGGVQLHVTDPAAFTPFVAGLAVLKHARAQAPRKFAWRKQAYEFVNDRLAIDLLLGQPQLRPMLEKGAALGQMQRSFAATARPFSALRHGVLHHR